MNRFQVKKSYQSGLDYILTGILLEGDIASGMNILVPLNSSLNISGEIKSIVKVEGMELLNLVISCEDSEETEFWESLQIFDEIIEIR